MEVEKIAVPLPPKDEDNKDDHLGTTNHVNINKFPGLSRDWAGGKMLFYNMCFLGSFFMGEKKHINNFPRESRGNAAIFCFSSQSLLVVDLFL